MENLSLKVEIDQNSGFCFGVVNVINIAEEQLDKHGELYCLGQIVHNGEEIKRLEKKGLFTIDHKELKEMRNERVLFRAHGEPPSSYELAAENNIEIVEASCPIILKLQNRIRQSYNAGETIYIFGKHNHPEVRGLIGQIDNNAVVFENLDELVLDELPNRITLYSQTTKSLEQFHEIIKVLSNFGIDVNVKDTICRKVSNRQPQLREFCKRFDVIVFVAGENSSNGKVLYNVCKQANDNIHFISSPDQLNSEWFNNMDAVGICGATSTPMWLMRNVEKILFSW